MCKGGSRTTNTTQNTNQNTTQDTALGTAQSGSAWNSGSAEALEYARRALGMGNNLPLGSPAPQQYIPNIQPNQGHMFDYAASGATASIPLLRRGMDASLNAGIDQDTAGDYLNRAGNTNVNLNPLDIQRYYNPYASNAFAALNQDLGVRGARLRSANNAAMGGTGGDRGAVSEALNFQQDQLARGQLASQFYDKAAGIASEQQGREYTADSGNRQNLFNTAAGFQSNAANRLNLANTNFNQYNAAQNRGMTGAQAQQQLDTARSAIDYQNQQQAYQQPYRNAAFYTDLIRGLLPTLGMQSGTEQSGATVGHNTGTMQGTTTGTQETSTQQDPFSMIAGLAMTGLGLATGNPMMGMKGLGSMGGGGMGGKGTGGGTGYSTNPWSTSGMFGPGGSGWWSGGEYGGPTGGTGGNWAYSNAKRGGRIVRKQGGGPLSFWERAEPVREAIDSEIFRSPEAPLSYPPAIPDTPYTPRNFNERAQPHVDSIAMGEMDAQGPNYTDFRGSPAMEGANAGAIPLPRERPEEAGPRDFSGAGGMEVPTRSANPYAPSAPRPLDTGADDYDIKLPEEPQYLRYKRPERNWSEFLLRAGLATLAARGDTDSGGVPKGSLSNIGKGALTALDLERKDREEARKETETENYNLNLSDAAKRWREQAKVTRLNAIDAAEERRLARESLDDYRKRMLEDKDRAQTEKERHNRAEEARKSFITANRDEQLKMGKPYSDDAIVYKAQVRADNWRKDKQRLIESGAIDRNSVDLEDGWQRVYDETRKAMLEAREQAFSRMRRPAPVQ